MIKEEKKDKIIVKNRLAATGVTRQSNFKK
jgi:hypothetical protein